MRINQFVAASSGLSRRAADAAIADGRITVAGRPAQLGETISDTASVQLDGQALTLPATNHYVMLNKPVGYVSSRARQGRTPTVYDLLPPELRNLRLAGRLDRDSSGLLLFATDGEFIYRYSHPSEGKRKIYELTLSRPLGPADLQQLAAGVSLPDGPSHVTVESSSGRELTVSLITGRNRQLRRTFDALGYTVERLHRTHIGPYVLGQLAAGSWQEVPPQ
jgi:23S rRNA pseudouridine2605 synthase